MNHEVNMKQTTNTFENPAFTRHGSSDVITFVNESDGDVTTHSDDETAPSMTDVARASNGNRLRTASFLLCFSLLQVCDVTVKILDIYKDYAKTSKATTECDEHVQNYLPCVKE